LLCVCLTALLLPYGCAEKNNPYDEAHRIAESYGFHFISWEFDTLFHDVLSGGRSSSVSSQERRLDESELSNNIAALLKENGITVFPPVMIRIEQPPHLLVISPRERIAYSDRLLLRQTMTIEEMQLVEKQVDALGFSSLVVELGGFGGTFPPIVSADASTLFIVTAAVEEWLHQYLAFKPLGFMYVLDSLGIRRDVDIVTMNETLVGIVSESIGSDVYERYYSDVQTGKADIPKNGFDFDAVMRETRKRADAYLEEGKVEEAEAYMEEQRILFLMNGYRIRKLNQAYFAFYGIYGQDPCSVTPVSEDIKRLSEMTSSSKELLETTAEMTSYSDLKKRLGR